jgi:hypothetical protein
MADSAGFSMNAGTTGFAEVCACGTVAEKSSPVTLAVEENREILGILATPQGSVSILKVEDHSTHKNWHLTLCRASL